MEEWPKKNKDRKSGLIDLESIVIPLSSYQRSWRRSNYWAEFLFIEKKNEEDLTFIKNHVNSDENIAI